MVFPAIVDLSSNCCRLTTTRTPFNAAVVSRTHRLMLAPIGFVVDWLSQGIPDGHDQALDAHESRTGRPADLRGCQVTKFRCSLWNHIEPSPGSGKLHTRPLWRNRGNRVRAERGPLNAYSTNEVATQEPNRDRGHPSASNRAKHPPRLGLSCI